MEKIIYFILLLSILGVSVATLVKTDKCKKSSDNVRSIMPKLQSTNGCAPAGTLLNSYYFQGFGPIECNHAAEISDPPLCCSGHATSGGGYCVCL